MRVHSLKTDAGPFESMIKGSKRFEYRKNDRSYEPGDVLHLRETDPSNRLRFTGRSVVALVTYCLYGPHPNAPVGAVNAYGVAPGYVCMSILIEDEEIQAWSPDDARRCTPAGRVE